MYLAEIKVRATGFKSILVKILYCNNNGSKKKLNDVKHALCAKVYNAYVEGNRFSFSMDELERLKKATVEVVSFKKLNINALMREDELFNNNKKTKNNDEQLV